MEVFQSPLREIYDRFTTSELVIMGWRSQEQAYKMRLRMKRPSGEAPVNEDTEVKNHIKNPYPDADIPEGTPDRLYDEEGNLNLSKGTLKDALKYMRLIGINMPAPAAGKYVNTGRTVEKP